MASVVMVVSGASVWTMKNATAHPTGSWSEEFVTPHRKFTQAGLAVTVASPGGRTPTVDPLSFNLSYNNNDVSKVAEQQEYMKRLGSALTSPRPVEDIDPDRFDAIFLVGRPWTDVGYWLCTRRWEQCLSRCSTIPGRSLRRCATALLASSRPRAQTEHGRLRTASSRASAMRKRRWRALAVTRYGSWKIACVFLARVMLQRRPGRHMRSLTATSSPGSKTTRLV